MQTAYIGMGANLPSAVGSPEATLAAAVTRLAGLGRVTAKSSLYSTAPVGFAGQPRFINAVAALETSLTPRELLDELLRIEKIFGRDRSAGVPNGPRTLDLDILLMGDLVVIESGIEIPHLRLADRAFVLVPLNEIAPKVRDPRSAMTAAELLKRLLAKRPSAADEVVKMEAEIWRAGGGVAG
jgi:2-amino-4-hydroxy-6-hydroxymethyldihydropteridine diphosphokinase